MGDDVVIMLIINLLESAHKNKIPPDPKEIQIQVTGFLEKDAAPFMRELWDHIVSASRNPGGIPTKMLEDAKKTISERGRKSYNRRKGIMEHERRRSKSTEKIEEPKEPKPPEPTPQELSIAQIKENIEKIRKQRHAERKHIPMTIADTLSKLTDKKLDKEEKAMKDALGKKVGEEVK